MSAQAPDAGSTLALQIEYRSLATLTPYARNARKHGVARVHPDAQVLDGKVRVAGHRNQSNARRATYNRAIAASRRHAHSKTVPDNSRESA